MKGSLEIPKYLVNITTTRCSNGCPTWSPKLLRLVVLLLHKSCYTSGSSHHRDWDKIKHL